MNNVFEIVDLTTWANRSLQRDKTKTKRYSDLVT